MMKMLSLGAAAILIWLISARASDFFFLIKNNFILNHYIFIIDAQDF